MTREPTRAARVARRHIARVALVAAAVSLLALMVAGPAVARPAAPTKAKAQPFMAKATVTTVDIAGGALTAKVVKANRAMKASIGKDVAFAVGASAVIVKISKKGATIIGIGDLIAGDRVLISGRIVGTDPTKLVFRARLIVDRGPAPTTT
jgi:hypothetical protein